MPARFTRRAALAASLGAALLACEPARDVVASARTEICDGSDNDGNGITDDVDADGDGLCDCLRIGVFGYPGIRDGIGEIRAWMRARAATTILAGEVLTRSLLAKFHILIVQDVRDGVADGKFGHEGVGVGIGRTFDDAEVQALEEWVHAGGGLLVLTGFGPSLEENRNVNLLLKPFGLSYSSQSILHALAGRSSNPVTHWDAAHPIASGITQVGVMNGYPILGGGTLVAWEPTQGAYDIGRAVESQLGHVFAWGDEWIEYDSEWSNPASQAQRLWLNALNWLTAENYCKVSPQR